MEITMFTTIIVALITAVIGPAVLEWVKAKLKKFAEGLTASVKFDYLWEAEDKNINFYYFRCKKKFEQNFLIRQKIFTVKTRNNE